MRKKFFTVSVQTDSFIKLHKREFYVPFQSLFFKKSILRFTNTKYFLLPAKQLMLENTDEIAGWLLHKL